MNAYGIMQGAAPSARAGGNVHASSDASQAQAGSAGGFAGMLVQVIGGGSGQTDATPEGKLPVGMIGSAELKAESAAADPNQAELLPLLQGLLEQLIKLLDTNQEIPAEFEQKLSSMFNLLQQLLHAPEGQLTDGSAADTALGDDLKAADRNGQPTAAASGRAMVPLMVETLQQWMGPLSQGELPIERLSALAGTLRQMQQWLEQQPSVRTPSDTGSGTSPSAALSDQTERHGQAASKPTAADSNPQHVAVKADATVLRTTAPFRQPLWVQQAAIAQTTDGQAQAANATMAAAAVDSPEPAVPSGTMSLWTMLKGDALAQPVNGPPSQSSSGAPIPVQQFAEQMGKYVMKQFVFSQGNGASEARISLHPEHLGQVNIKILIQNGMLTAKFIAANGMARELLESQMAQLRTALQGQGLQIDKVEVVQQSHASSASFFQHQHREQGSGYARDQSGNRGTKNMYTEAAEFAQELERTASLRDIGYGSSLNVTA